jgi:hypothetical protein
VATSPAPRAVTRSTSRPRRRPACPRAATPYTPSDANDGVTEAANCNAWAWIQAGNAPGGNRWITYLWPTAQTIAKIHMDTSSATVTDSCGNLGRTIGAAQVQWWNGAAWVTDGTVSGKLDDWDYAFTHFTETRALLSLLVTRSPYHSA